MATRPSQSALPGDGGPGRRPGRVLRWGGASEAPDKALPAPTAQGTPQTRIRCRDSPVSGPPTPLFQAGRRGARRPALLCHLRSRGGRRAGPGAPPWGQAQHTRQGPEAARGVASPEGSQIASGNNLSAVRRRFYPRAQFHFSFPFCS